MYIDKLGDLCDVDFYTCPRLAGRYQKPFSIDLRRHGPLNRYYVCVRDDRRLCVADAYFYLEECGGTVDEQAQLLLDLCNARHL